MGSVQFLISNYQLAKSIEPGMTCFNYPTTCLEVGIFCFFKFFFAARANMRSVTRSNYFLFRFITGICCIGAQIFLFILHYRLDNFPTQNCIKLANIMPVRSGYDDGQRDSTSVHKNVSLASFFFPDPWDLPQSFLAPMETCTCYHLWLAIARRYLPYHHIRKDRVPKALEKNHAPPTHENSDELHSGFQKFLLARLSTVCQYAKHTLFLQRLCEGHRLSTTANLTFIFLFLRSYRVRNQRFYNGPKTIRHFPRFYFHLSLLIGEKHNKNSRECLVIYG